MAHHDLSVIDLSSIGRRGVAVCWRAFRDDAPALGGVALIQVRKGRLLARLGLLTGERAGITAGDMALAALVPAQDDGVILVTGPDGGELALAFALGDDMHAVTAVGGAPGAGEELTAMHGRDVAPYLRAAFADDWDAVALTSRHGLPVQAACALMDAAPAGRNLRDMLDAHPMAMAAALSSRTVLDALREGAEPHAAFALACPGYTPAHLRRCRGVAADVFDPLLRTLSRQARRGAAMTALRLCATLPPDRMPSASEWMDAALVAEAVEASYVLDPTCVAAARGGWSANAMRLRRLAGVPPEANAFEAVDRIRSAARDMGDASAALSVQVMLPLAAWGRRRAGLGIDLGGPGDLEVPCLSAARDALFGDKAITACLEASLRWHRHQDVVARSFMTASADLRWPVPFPPFRFPDGGGVLEAVPVGDALTLYEEGTAGRDRNGSPGLDHCVFGRLGAALRGDAHVLSVRRLLPGGGYERLSTAQLDLGNVGFTVVEHGGRANAMAPEACGRLLAALSERYADVALDVMPRNEAPDDPIRDACGYDWNDAAALTRALDAWSPHLPRWLRGRGPAEAYRALAERGLLPGEPVRLAA